MLVLFGRQSNLGGKQESGKLDKGSVKIQRQIKPHFCHKLLTESL